MRFFEKRLKAAPRGGTEVGRGCRAQLEDLLIALADRRSFPETLFFVARGIVGETWSTESVVAPVVFPASVLALLVKEPEGGEMEAEFLYRQRWQGLVGLCVITVYPSMLCHARGCSHNQDYPVHWIFTNIHRPSDANCLSLFFPLTH